MNQEKRDRIQDLAHGQIEKRLSAEEWRELNQCLEADGEARGMYLDLMHDHAALHWSQVGEAGRAEDRMPGMATFPLRWHGVAAAAVVIILGMLALGGFRDQDSAGSFATMIRTDAARWESAGQPTADGSRLGAGRLKLTEGLATLEFDSGAELILEGPAELELIDAMNGILISGTLVAEMPESAWGFTIGTPTANVIDHGTRFAVNVDPGTGETRTEVFDGLVEVALPGGGESVRLATGQRNRVAGRELGGADPSENEGTWAPAMIDEAGGPGRRIITTADRNGEDGYAFSHPSAHVSDEVLLLKNSSQVRWPESKGGPNRKTWLRFDLAEVPADSWETAELRLWFTPTGWGLASHLPDSVFVVHGIVDDALDAWNHAGLSWESAPANVVERGDAVDGGRTVRLGEFTVPRGVQSGWFGIRSEALGDFLKEDGNRLASLIVVRETAEMEGGGLVHGIASSRHPTLPPPRLILTDSE